MHPTVTFCLLICSAICCAAKGVDWNPKFTDGSKGRLDCGTKWIHMEEVKWVSGNCTAMVTELYRMYCEGKHTCDLRTIMPQNWQNFGCHIEGRPTLYYTSTCYEMETPVHTVTVMQGGNQQIDCGNDKMIYIRSANYTTGTCGYNVHIPVDGLCGRRHTCDLNPATMYKNPWFTFDNYYGVKCPGNDRMLTVQYFCWSPPPTETRQFFAVMPANEEMTLTCPQNQQMTILRSYYGYADMWDDTTTMVRGICSGQPDTKCTYKPGTPFFSDYDGYWDFNIVYYCCMPETPMPESPGFMPPMEYLFFEEGQRVNMNCTDGMVLDINYAFYGTGGWQADVTVPVKADCQHENSCTFWANNEMFMDPRGGLKYFTVAYYCRPPRWNDLTYVTFDHNELGMIDCHGQFINIMEAFYGGGYMWEDVTANRIFDRCETKWTEPFRNTYCVMGARDIYFGTVGMGKLTVGYFCSPHQHVTTFDRRTRRYMYGTGENRDTSYYYPYMGWMGNNYF